jgi:hypothetical protein
MPDLCRGGATVIAPLPCDLIAQPHVREEMSAHPLRAEPDSAPYSFSFEMQHETRKDECPLVLGDAHLPRLPDDFDASAMGWTIHT